MSKLPVDACTFHFVASFASRVRSAPMHRMSLIFSAGWLSLFASVALAQDRDQNIARCQDDNFDTAISGCTALIQSDWETDYNLSVTYFYRGLAYFRTEDHGRAIQDFDEAIRLNPSFRNAFFQRGDVYLTLQDYDRAIQNFDEVIRLDPDDDIAFRYRGDAYLAKEDYDRAIQNYDAAIGLDPNNADFFSARGNAYLVREEYDRAIQDFDEVLRLDPSDADAVAARARASAGQ